jgi:hypothetical protein
MLSANLDRKLTTPGMFERACNDPVYPRTLCRRCAIAFRTGRRQARRPVWQGILARRLALMTPSHIRRTLIGSAELCPTGRSRRPSRCQYFVRVEGASGGSGRGEYRGVRRLSARTARHAVRSVRALLFRTTVPIPQPAGKVLALGSGFIIDPRGYIVTNNQLVGDADKVTGQQPACSKDNRTRRKDRYRPLKIDANRKLPFVTWRNRDEAKVGDWVVAVGNVRPRRHGDRGGRLRSRPQSLKARMTIF